MNVVLCALAIFAITIPAHAQVDNDRAIAEAAELGFTSQPLKVFALDYIQTHKR
jgi:hypothetical protein